MTRKIRVFAFVIALALVSIAAVVFLTLSSPTPVTSAKSLDYLKIVGSLSAIQGRVEAEKAAKNDPLRSLSEGEIQQVKEGSDGLVRQVNLRADGAIGIAAVVSSNGVDSDSLKVSIRLLLVPEKSGEKYDWQCYGSPVSALPSFCRELP